MHLPLFCEPWLPHLREGEWGYGDTIMRRHSIPLDFPTPPLVLQKSSLCSQVQGRRWTECKGRAFLHGLLVFAFQGNLERFRNSSITDSMGTSLSKLREWVMDKEGWRAAVHGIVKSWTQLSNWSETELNRYNVRQFYKSVLYLINIKLNYIKLHKNFKNSVKWNNH